MIDPNTKEFHNYTDESFQYGWCGKCGHGTVLTDTDEVKEDIDRIYQRYVEEKKEEPEYAVCVVVWKDDNNSEHVKSGSLQTAIPMKRMIFLLLRRPLRSQIIVRIWRRGLHRNGNP